jgi:hypothetical protein
LPGQETSEEEREHMGTAARTAAVDPVEEAETARDELREALADAGILLPSLGLDLVTFGSDHLPPLVELGRCSPRVARRLAAALRGAKHGR